MYQVLVHPVTQLGFNGDDIVKANPFATPLSFTFTGTRLSTGYVISFIFNRNAAVAICLTPNEEINRLLGCLVLRL